MSEFRWAPNMSLHTTPQVIRQELAARNRLALRRWHAKRMLVSSGNLTTLDPRPLALTRYYDWYYGRMREAARSFLSRLAFQRHERERLQRLVDDEVLVTISIQHGSR